MCCRVYSVCSAVGMLPLSLQYGYDIMAQFLAGANSVDEHFLTADFKQVCCNSGSPPIPHPQPLPVADALAF